MSGKIDIKRVKARSAAEVHHAVKRYAQTEELHYLLRRWVAAMTAVEIHAIWERYVESRLVAALNHHPKHFLQDQDITGATAISTGLARYVVRGGNRFFDFRSTADLIGKANRWLGPSANPFSSLTREERAYLDCLAAIRNCIVHRSDAATAAYKKNLKVVYGIKAAPGPEEFLHAKDLMRGASPARYRNRIVGLAVVTAGAIIRT